MGHCFARISYWNLFASYQAETMTPTDPSLAAPRRAYLKRRVFRLVRLEVSLLPLDEQFLSWLREEKAGGRRLVLATASEYEQACLVVRSLRLFDSVLGSDGQRNLKGRHKLDSIVDACGEKFDYAGNSRADLAIWRACQHAVLVNAPKGVERLARRAGNVVRVFPPSLGGLQDILRAMRCYQWVKNLLLFVPAITSHTIFDWSATGRTALAYLSFSLCASAANILNDLLDLEDDRATTPRDIALWLQAECLSVRYLPRPCLSCGRRRHSGIRSRAS
jgi:hypothetical protein